MNKRHCFLLGLVSGAVMFAAGCSPSFQPVSYYNLAEPAAVTATVKNSHHRLALVIGPVSLPDRLKQSRLVFGTGGNFQLSDQHRWADDLDHDIARAIAEQLAVRLETEQVSVYPDTLDVPPSHRIAVEVLTLEGLPGQVARLIVRWSLIDPHTNTTRLIRRSVFTEYPTDRSQAAWVAAQRHNISRLSKEIAHAIETAGR
ncbi:MAG: membrane integrity-associated transporter subunit PqiC [Desulfobulbus sp.]|nr:membrane integrity-associated transporter subunit PqiC [Desulfobulbus sp.]